MDTTTPATRLVTTDLGHLATTLHPGDPRRTPLVLGHGILLDSSIWADVLPTLRGRTILTVDGPAHGGSDAPTGRWNLDGQVRALIQVLDQHGLDRPVLAGHSWGGMVALRATLAHPDRVAGLGLVNTPLTRTGRLGRATFRAQLALLRTLGPTPFYARRAAAALYAPSSLRRRPELADRMVARLAGRPGRDLARAVDAVILRATDQLAELHRLGVPVAVLAGADDYVLPDSVRTAVRAALPQAVLATAAGGHVSPEEDPATVGRTLRDLLTVVEATVTGAAAEVLGGGPSYTESDN